MYVQSAVQFHAHKCEACAKNGKEVIWIHPNTCAGQVQAHKCPECGSVEWKQCKVESGKLPQLPQPKAQAIDVANTVLAWTLIVAGLALLAYSAYVFVKERKTIDVKPL